MIIQTINLTKRYGKLVALNNLHLDIEEGECFGYIGPNGAGKTTTIKILATLLQPTWGEARVCGHVVGYESRKIRPLIGYVPDFFGAYEDMVVQEYLEFFASAYNIQGKQRTRVVPGYDQRIEVFGTSGVMTADNPPDVDDGATGGTAFFTERYGESYLAEMRAFVDCVRRDPTTSVFIAWRRLARAPWPLRYTTPG